MRQCTNRFAPMSAKTSCALSKLLCGRSAVLTSLKLHDLQILDRRNRTKVIPESLARVIAALQITPRGIAEWPARVDRGLLNAGDWRFCPSKIRNSSIENPLMTCKIHRHKREHKPYFCIFWYTKPHYCVTFSISRHWGNSDVRVVFFVYSGFGCFSVGWLTGPQLKHALTRGISPLYSFTASWVLALQLSSLPLPLASYASAPCLSSSPQEQICAGEKTFQDPA